MPELVVGRIFIVFPTACAYARHSASVVAPKPLSAHVPLVPTLLERTAGPAHGGGAEGGGGGGGGDSNVVAGADAAAGCDAPAAGWHGQNRL